MSEMDRPPVSLIERDNQGLDDEELADITVETIANGMQPLDMPLGIEIIEEEDGGVILDFSSGSERSDDFYANLAEELDARELGSIASELFGEYESNRASRHDWEEAYSKGLELLGLIPKIVPNRSAERRG